MGLLSIESSEEKDYLKKLFSELNISIHIDNLILVVFLLLIFAWLIAGSSTMWWTSGSDETEEGRWIWTATGQRFSFTNWIKGQPFESIKHNYLQFSKQMDMGWFDRKIAEKYFSICEI